MRYSITMIHAKTLYSRNTMFRKFNKSRWFEVFRGCILKIHLFLVRSNFKTPRAAKDTGHMRSNTIFPRIIKLNYIYMLPMTSLQKKMDISLTTNFQVMNSATPRTAIESSSFTIFFDFNNFMNFIIWRIFIWYDFILFYVSNINYITLS